MSRDNDIEYQDTTDSELEFSDGSNGKKFPYNYVALINEKDDDDDDDDVDVIINQQHDEYQEEVENRRRRRRHRNAPDDGQRAFGETDEETESYNTARWCVNNRCSVWLKSFTSPNDLEFVEEIVGEENIASVSRDPHHPDFLIVRLADMDSLYKLVTSKRNLWMYGGTGGDTSEYVRFENVPHELTDREFVDGMQAFGEILNVTRTYYNAKYPDLGRDVRIRLRNRLVPNSGWLCMFGARVLYRRYRFFN